MEKRHLPCILLIPGGVWAVRWVRVLFHVPRQFVRMWHPYKYVQIIGFVGISDPEHFALQIRTCKPGLRILTLLLIWRLFRKIFFTCSGVPTVGAQALRRFVMKILFFTLTHRIGFDLKTNYQKVTAEELTWHQSDQTIEFEHFLVSRVFLLRHQYMISICIEFMWRQL